MKMTLSLGYYSVLSNCITLFSNSIICKYMHIYLFSENFYNHEDPSVKMLNDDLAFWLEPISLLQLLIQ